MSQRSSAVRETTPFSHEIEPEPLSRFSMLFAGIVIAYS
jgi:hypothetical protein